MMSNSSTVYRNILEQPQALEKVFHYQLGQGAGQLKRAAGAILDARQVVIAAIGASYAACYTLVYSLAELGIKVILEDASELLHYNLPVYGSDTTYILISRSGDTVEITRLVEHLKGNSGPLIGITNVRQSCLGNNCDILLSLECPPDDLIAIQTWSATLLLFDLLAAAVAGRLQDADYHRQLHSAVASVAETCARYREISPAWSSCFTGLRSIYLLARGASQASAAEAQLLFHEMAWHPAVFFSAGNFRHGPWEVVEPGFLGFVFAPQDDCFDLNRNLAADINRLGGKAVLVSQAAGDRESQAWLTLEVPQLPAALSPLVEIIPLQFFVYEFATWLGRKPGEFRISTPITLTEGEMVDVVS